MFDIQVATYVQLELWKSATIVGHKNHIYSYSKGYVTRQCRSYYVPTNIRPPITSTKSHVLTKLKS